MIVEYKLNGYEQFIKIREKKLIYFDCSCPDFTFRKIQLRELCKHLKELTSRFDKEVLNEQDV